MHKSIQLILGLVGFWVPAPALLFQANAMPPSAPAVPANKLGLELRTTLGFIPAQLERSRFPFEGRRNIFGKDDRIPMNSSKYPWSAIGRIEAFKDKQMLGTCTGTLIGKRLVVTNAHCIVNEVTKKITSNKIRFRPNLINGEAPAEALASRVVLGTNDPRGDRGNDWAFLILDRPLGETYGWMKFVVDDFADLASFKDEIILVGYSSDFPKEKPSETAGVHKGCSIRGFGSQLGTIAHDCDMMAGASGGPMFKLLPDGSAAILALNAAERVSPEGKKVPKFSRETANIGVYAATWAGKAEELLKTQR
ncbi:serine protease [Leptolyngbyaceae cyanobacterium UHCC 1019]